MHSSMQTTVRAPRRIPQHRRSNARSARSTLPLLLVGTLLPLFGCQGISGPLPTSQVRIIHASPDAGSLDVSQDSGPLAYNLGLGTISSYVPVATGNYGITADIAGTHQHLVSASSTFLENAQYTVLISNTANALQEVILKDQTQPAPAGQVSLRFTDQSTRAGAVDLYLVPTGSTITQVRPILTNFAFTQNTGYINLAAGAYTLIAVPAGTTPTTASGTSYTGPAITYPAGAARTIVLIDQQTGSTPGLQAVIANDVDPTSVTN